MTDDRPRGSSVEFSRIRPGQRAAVWLHPVRGFVGTAVAVSALILLAGCDPGATGSTANPNQEVCDDIRSAIRIHSLDDRGVHDEIVRASDQVGVATGIRHAIVSYYAGNRDGGTAMQARCTEAAANQP